MRTLIVLALLGSAFASPFLQDTPEVVAERARFQQLFNAQAAAAAAAPDDPTEGARYQQAKASSQWTAQPQASQWSAQPSNQWNAPQTHQYFPHYQNTIPGVTHKWTGPVAATVPAGVDGRITPVSDTAEVAAARAAFLNTYNAALAATRPSASTKTWSAAPKQTWSAAPQQTWSAAPQQTWSAAPQQTWSAAPQQTWSAAKQQTWSPAHQQTWSAAKQQTWSPAPQQTWSPATQHTWSATPQVQPRWTGPMASTIPAGLPGAGSQVAQTAEVAAATSAFQQAYSDAVAATTGRRY